MKVFGIFITLMVMSVSMSSVAMASGPKDDVDTAKSGETDPGCGAISDNANPTASELVGSASTGTSTSKSTSADGDGKVKANVKK